MIMESRGAAFPSRHRVSGRIAAVGDIHGRPDRLLAALSAISDPAETEVILLGDYVDRGPDTLGVLEMLRELEADHPFRDLVILAGNHDQMVFEGAAGDDEALGSWLINGGMHLIMDEMGNPGDIRGAARDLASLLPRQLAARLRGEMPLWHASGSVTFIHAGIPPGAGGDAFLHAPFPSREGEEHHHPLWVREPFLERAGGHVGPYGSPTFVVHGHTCLRAGGDVPGAVLDAALSALCRDRIGIDTSNRDHALLLEADGAEMRLTFVLPDPRPAAEARVALLSLREGFADAGKGPEPG